MKPWVEAGLALTLAVAVAALDGCRSPQTPQPAPRKPSPEPRTSAPSAPPAPQPAPKPLEPVSSGNADLRIRIGHGFTQLTLQCDKPLHAEAEKSATDLAPGAWTVKLTQAKPPRTHFHVILKTFKPGEARAMDAFMAQWRARGYPVKALLLGSRFETASGHVLDGREYWVSLQRFEQEKDAKALKRALEAESQWAWIRAEVVQPGSGVVSVAGGGTTVNLTIPATLTATAPVRVTSSEDRQGHAYTGKLGLSIEPDQTLAVYETISVEDYLAGVLPAEMPALWPAEALKAQAVSARSDVLAHMALKHTLEGFNFTNGEQDRVYGGFGGRRPETDAAVQATRGQVISDGTRIVPAVFSADCGGWTEDNDSVWSSPPDPGLRGVADMPPGKASASPAANFSTWIQSRPAAYCRDDGTGFRWSRSLTAAEVTRLVNQRYKVGTVRAIVMGDRGVSGRLKWVRVEGSLGTATIRKELPIRQAFGGLPSAMVTISPVRDGGGVSAFAFVGGGRGHGVGLCQYGARGMALQGLGYEAILRHYFASTTLEAVR